MSSPAMRARMAVLGLEIWDSRDFFEMLKGLGNTEKVDLRTFVSGCMQMRGPAQRITMLDVLKQVTALTTHRGSARARSLAPLDPQRLDTMIGGSPMREK